MKQLDLPEQVAEQPLTSSAAQELVKQAVEVHMKVPEVVHMKELVRQAVEVQMKAGEVVQSPELIEVVPAAVWVQTACTCTSNPRSS